MTRSRRTLQGKVALVTGASRGGGRGIACALGEAGATVYLTGRSVRGGPTTLGRPGTIDETAEEILRRGGTAEAVRCDHFNDSDVEALFARIRNDKGTLDVLVNNAWAGYEIAPEAQSFWNLEPRHWDLMFGSVRAAVMAAAHAARLMVPRHSGLIVNVTWIQADGYAGNLFYDVCKNAVNRMTWAMSKDLAPNGITAVALSPGWMNCERMHLSADQAEEAESTEFPGRAIVHLASDDNVDRFAGRLVTTPEIAYIYGFTDVNGRQMSPFWEDYWRRRYPAAVDEHPPAPRPPSQGNVWERDP